MQILRTKIQTLNVLIKSLPLELILPLISIFTQVILRPAELSVSCSKEFNLYSLLTSLD